MIIKENLHSGGAAKNSEGALEVFKREITIFI